MRRCSHAIYNMYIHKSLHKGLAAVCSEMRFWLLSLPLAQSLSGAQKNMANQGRKGSRYNLGLRFGCEAVCRCRWPVPLPAGYLISCSTSDELPAEDVPENQAEQRAMERSCRSCASIGPC